MRSPNINIIHDNLNEYVKKKKHDLYIINVFKETKLKEVFQKLKEVIFEFKDINFNDFEKIISLDKKMQDIHYLPLLNCPHILIMGHGSYIHFQNDKSDDGFYKKDIFIMENYRTQISKIPKYIEKYNRKSVLCMIQNMEESFQPIRNFVESICIGSYNFSFLKGKKSKKIVKEYSDIFIDLLVYNNMDLPKKELSIEKNEQINTELNIGKNIGQYTSFVRDLINYPANICTPKFFVDQVIEQIKKKNLKNIHYKVLDRKEIEKEQMNSFLSVANGSSKDPKFLILHYEPKKKETDHILGLIGKGITFDTGGISLKPSRNMHKMKADMSGAAVVAGSILSIAQIGFGVEVKAYIPLCENIPSSKATTPGNVVVAKNGVSIEILDTDAEGRLILADAMSYAGQKSEGITHMIDIATLTGAIVVALGEITTGVLGNHRHFIQKFMEICQLSGERIWELPLFDKYDLQIKSNVADIANIGKGYAGSITAASFLKNFVPKNIPWLHLDIAGTSWSEGNRNLYSEGGASIMLSSITLWARAISQGFFSIS